MTQIVPRYIMLRTARFAPLREALGAGLDMIDADWRAARRHVWRSLGPRRALRLLLASPERRHYGMAEGNLLRKMRRFPRLGAIGWLCRFYHWRKAKHAQLAERLIEDRLANAQGAVALVYNGHNVPDSVLAHVAPRHRRLFIENGYFAGTIQADPCGINALNGLPRDPDFYRSYRPDDRPLRCDPNRRVAKHATDAARALPAGYVFVPFQLDSDSQMTRHSPWIRDMAHLHHVLYALAEACPDLTFVVKEHPNARATLAGTVHPHDRIIFQNGRDTQTLIDGARLVLTVNSTVGVEAISRGKTVITLGEACYAIPGIALRVGDAEALRIVLSQPERWAPDPDLVHRFLHYLTYRFLTPETGHREHETVHERIAGLLAGRPAPEAQRTEMRDSRRDRSSYSASRSSSDRKAPISTSRPLPDKVT